MSVPKLKIENAKIVDLCDALRILQAKECEEYNIPLPSGGSSTQLPDGSDTIDKRLWDEIIDTNYGNQQFSNDTLYIYYATDEEVTFSEDKKKLIELCKDAINYDPILKGIGKLYFNVSW
jgi:hypothetical protein